MTTYDVFISYSDDDGEWVRDWLLPRLEGAGLRVCIDFRDFEVGVPSLVNMEQAAKRSRKTLLVLTPNWVKSEWTNFEALLVQTSDPIGLRRRILPLMLEPCELPDRIAMLTYANFTTPEGWESELGRIISSFGEPGVPAVPGLPSQPCIAHPYPLQEHFTGRARERQMLTQWLKDNEHPVLALVAIGGMGKSALTWVWLQRDVLGLPVPGLPKDEPDVAEACRVPEDARPDGVLWWSFYEREARCAAFLDKALTYASGGEVDPGQIASDYDKLRELLALLRQRRLLLVLDGLERELRAYAGLSAAYQGDAVPEDVQGDPNSCTDPHAAAFLRQVTTLAGASRVLLTSRLSPRELDGLAGCRREELAALDRRDAVAFFRAQGVKGTRAEIEAACAPYGYHPLALGLLAGMIVGDPARPKDVTVAAEYSPIPDLVPREHHILALAYDALSPELQELLSRLAAFRSPVEYEALKVLSSFADEQELKRALRELIDRRLLLHDRERGRYDLHPVVRRYAYDRLIDKAGVHSRLCDYFAAVPAPQKVQSLEDLAPVIELYHHTVRAGRYDEAHALYGDRLSEPLYFRFGAYQRCIELLRELFPDGEDRPPRLKRESDQAWTLNALAASYALSGQSRRAVPLLEQHNAIQEKQGDKKNLAIGLGNLATQQTALGELAAAEASLRRRIDLCREVGNQWNEAIGHQDLGRLLAFRGVLTESEQHLMKAQEVFDRMGTQKTNFVSVVRAYRAECALVMGEAKAALAAASRARELADEVGRILFPMESDIIRAEWLLGAAHVALASGEGKPQDQALAEAERHLTKAINRCRGINLVELEPDILLAWARWRRARGDPQQARRDAEEALAITDRCEYRLKQADARNLLAQLALDDGDSKAARQHAKIARDHAWCGGPPHCYKPALDEAEGLLAAAS